MEFGKHIEKGLWAFADKALPAVYGIGTIFLVLRILPEKEYGGVVIIQTIFTLISTFGYSFALQPMTKFVAEHENRMPYVWAGFLMITGFFALATVLILSFSGPLVHLLDPKHESNLPPLLAYLPYLFGTALYRTFAVSLLQARYDVQKIFWIDATYFLGVLALIGLALHLHSFSTAADVLRLNVIAQGCSAVLAFLLTRRQITFRFTPDRKAFAAMWYFGKYAFIAAVLYNLFAQFDVFIISSIVGLIALALYNAAKILTRGFDMIVQILMTFLLPFSSKHYASRDIEKLVVVAEKSICFSMVLFLPVFLVMFFLPGPLLGLLYHGRYADAAPIVRTLSFLSFVVPWSAVASSYMAGMGKVRESLYFGIGLVVFSLSATALCTSLFGPIGAAMALVISSTLFSLSLTLYIRRLIPYSFFGVLSRVRDIWSFVRSRRLI